MREPVWEFGLTAIATRNCPLQGIIDGSVEAGDCYINIRIIIIN
jgi:hypothetical protein